MEPALIDRLWLQRGCVALAALAVFSTSVPGPFLKWDDTIYVTENARIQRPGWAAFQQLWSSDDVWQNRQIEFFPLRDTFYWATWQLFPNNPAPFHLVNLVAHALVAVLVLQLARRLGLTPGASFLGALLFAVHPIHVESVTWIAALKDPLFTGLMLGSVLCYLRYRRSLRPVDYALCVLLMVAALLSKSIALVTPLLLLLLDRLLAPPPSWRRSLARVAGPGLISALFLIQFVLIGKLNGVIGAPHGGTWGQHYFLMAWSLVRYVQQVIAPATFRIHYCFEPLDSALDLRLLGIALALAVLAAVSVALSRRREPLVGLLIAWFFVCLAPVANVIPFPAIMADRYLYAPSVAGCLLLALALSRLPVMGRWLGPAVVGMFALVTLGRGLIWQDPANLWAEAVEDDACLRDDLPTAAWMYLNRAQTAVDPAVVLVNYKKAISHPRFGRLAIDHQALFLRKATISALQGGDLALARHWSELAIKVAPTDPYVWANRVLTVGDDALALAAAERAFRLERSADSYWVLGAARVAMKQPAGVDDLVTAVRLEPRRYCGYFLSWLEEEVAQPDQARLGEVRRRCERAATAEPRQPK